MAYSYNRYISNGVTTTFTAPPYLEAEHISVEVQGVALETSAYTLTGTIVNLLTPPLVSQEVIVRRSTSPSTRLVTFNSTYLDEADLNKNSDQLLYLMQEALDAQVGVAEYLDNITTTEKLASKALTGGQTVVVFSETLGAEPYFRINGESVDNTLLSEGIDYTLDLPNRTVTLSESYPAGTVLSAYGLFTALGGEDFNTTQVAQNVIDIAQNAVDIAQNAVDIDVLEADTINGKELLGKGFNSSLASLPRLYRKLTEYNESTSTQIKIVGMGSSVGNGAGTSDPATFSPVVQFANRVEAKFNKLGIYNIVTSNQSVNGSTLSGGAADIDSVLSSEQPDVILLTYGMNDGGTSQYNANMSYPFVEANLKTIISKCHEADCDVIVCTTPHPNTDTQSFAMNPVLAMNYPTASWALTEGFSFTSGSKQINSTTSGAFTNTANGFGLTVGRKINISGTASNDGDYTIATIDGSGDFITVSEAIVTESTVTCTIKRNTILDSELVPTVPNSTPSIDALGYGVGNEVIVSHRHYRVNQAMRKAAIESGVSVVDVEHYWFEAVHTAGGVASFYDVGETVHPNDAGYTQSYNYGLFDFVDSISESYVLGVQQNSLLPSVSIETSRRTASLEVGQKSTSTEVATFSNEAGAPLLTVDGTLGVVFDPSVDLVAGGVVQQVSGNIAVTTSVGSKFNQTTAWDVPTTTDSQGKIIITATQSGIGKQCVEYGFSNNAGTTTVIQAFTVGSSVLTSVTGSGDNVVITPAAANTNIRWQLVEIT